MRTPSVSEVPVGLRIALTLAVLSAASVSLKGQSTKLDTTTQDISFLPKWSKGESRVYEQVKGRRLISKDGKSIKADSRARLDIKVVDASPQGNLLSWMITESSIGEPTSPKQPSEYGDLVKSMEGWNVLLDIDESGNLQGIRNWRELKSKIEGVQNSLMKNQMYQTLSPDTQELVRAQLKARSQSKEQIEDLCAREAKAFLAPIGLRFKAGKPIEYESRLPNPRGGQPFPTRARFEISKIDPTTARAIITWRQVVRPSEAGTSLGETVGRLGRSFGRPPSPSDSNPYKSISITDECQYLMDINGGWVNDMKQLRTIRNQDGSVIEESLRIRRSENEPKKAKGESPTPKTVSPNKSG